MITLGGCQSQKSKLYHIGITQLMTNPGIDAVRKGFLAEMDSLGYVDGKNIRYSMKNSQGSDAAASTIAHQLVDDKVNMIFAITTPTAEVCASAIKGTTIPMVFGAVTDPVAAGLVETLQKPGGNITGTSDKWPIAAQFDLLLKLVPSVKRIGVVYNPGEINSEVTIKEVAKVCEEDHLKLVTASVSNTSQVYAAARSLVGRIDAFYVSADNTVITAMDAVVKISEQYKIPLLPGVSSNVKQGGFGTLGPNYFDIGEESAKIADKIIKGQKPGDIPVATAHNFDYFFNLKSAKATNVTIPDSLLKIAAEVYR